jgi:hypothetical protein
MAHDAGKGGKPRPFSVPQEDYTKNLEAIIGKPEVDDDDWTCDSCGGPMYSQPHWLWSYCDDCGTRVKKEPMEP